MEVIEQPDGIFGIFEVVKDFYAHGIDEHFIVFALMLIVALDIVLGVSRAWAYHDFSSRKWRKGLVSHTAMILITAIGYPFALYMNLAPIVDAFIMAMMAAYGSSILASLSALGVEIPGLDRFVKQNIDHEKFQLKEGLEQPSKEMNQITDIVVSGAMSILVVLVGIVVNSVKQYLLTRGGKKALETAEILAKNAVQATEQVADKLDIHGADKLEHAKTSLIEGLEAYNIYLTNDQLNTFIESAVKTANDAWKK